MSRIPRVAVVCICLITVFFLTGCATLQTVKESRGQGIKRIYNYSFADVYRATLNSVYQQGIKIVEYNEEEGYLYASHGITAWSWGEKIAIFVNKIDENRTGVEIVSRKVVSPLNIAPDWAGKIFKGIEEELRTKK